MAPKAERHSASQEEKRRMKDTTMRLTQRRREGEPEWVE